VRGDPGGRWVAGAHGRKQNTRRNRKKKAHETWSPGLVPKCIRDGTDVRRGRGETGNGDVTRRRMAAISHMLWIGEGETAVGKGHSCSRFSSTCDGREEGVHRDMGGGGRGEGVKASLPSD